MASTYNHCTNLTGSPVCGNKVTTMSFTYNNCTNLTGSPVCGENVTIMTNAYSNCYNLAGNAYFYSNLVSAVSDCFAGRNISNRLNIYVHSGSTTYNTLMRTNISSLIGQNITWTDDFATNGCYYNATANIYIYPVANVAEARATNGD
jgi:YHS domain-containing protein